MRRPPGAGHDEEHQPGQHEQNDRPPRQHDRRCPGRGTARTPARSSRRTAAARSVAGRRGGGRGARRASRGRHSVAYDAWTARPSRARRSSSGRCPTPRCAPRPSPAPGRLRLGGVRTEPVDRRAAIARPVCSTGGASRSTSSSPCRRTPRLGRMTSTAIAPAAISPRRPVPDSIPRPEYVDQPAPAPFTGSEVKDAETIERIRVACRLAAQARELVGSARRARRHHRRARPGRPRVPLRPRRLPLDPRLQGLPEVAVLERQRGRLPRHPRRPGDRGRRHRQHRHHRLPRRRARRHQRHLPGRRRRRGDAPARRAHPRGARPGDQGRQARAPGQRRSAG